MNTLIVVGYYTIWFTPAIFVINIIRAIKAIKNNEETSLYTFIASLSLMLIVIPMYMMLMLK